MRVDVRTCVHDINGVLGAMLAMADLEAKRVPDTARGQAAFASIAEQARKAGALLERLTQAATASEEGSDSTHERDLDYIDGAHPAIDAVLADLESRGRSEGIPIVDRETGRFLSVMTSCMLAANILEIGTAFGYSTLWMARSQPEGGSILTIDPDRERTAVAAGFFERSGVASHIQIVNQPALAVLPTLPKRHYDIIFVDALKEEYPQYLELAVPLLKKSGLLIADNVLWAHAASQPPAATDPATTKAIRRFNEELLKHPQLNATIVPIGDGLGIAAKIV